MIIADLHIHSRFSRATSKNLNFDNLERYAKIKGVHLLGTGDFQYPKWNEEIKNNLDEDENGVLWSKTKFPFLWQTEISLMYSQDGKSRRVHHIILAPDKGVVDQIIEVLGKKGRLDYDGRPIFGFSSVELVEMMDGISDKIEIIPAHCMTSWFGLFGSNSGFDSLKQCFKDKVKNIHAVESGMSADPSMLWRLKEDVNIVSFSDLHSFWPWRLGREASVFNFKNLTYNNVLKAIRTGEGFNSTIEVIPSYGKYHIDGHRACNFSCNYKESRTLNGICPVCRKPLTIGVEYRIEELAKEPKGWMSENAIEFKSIIPLHELIAAVYSTSILSSTKVWSVYNKLISKFENEFNVLLNVSEKDLLEIVDKRLVDIILKNRDGKIKIKPGYDGVYGQLVLDDKDKIISQKTLSSFG